MTIKLSPVQQDEFLELTQPLLAYLDTLGHPHVSIIITPTSAELVEHLLGYKNTSKKH